MPGCFAATISLCAIPHPLRCVAVVGQRIQLLVEKSGDGNKESGPWNFKPWYPREGGKHNLALEGGGRDVLRQQDRNEIGIAERAPAAGC